MVIKVGINGFGRVGRVVFRTCLENSDIEVSAINDPAIEVDYISYLIKFDSTHGRLPGNVSFTENEIRINEKRIMVFRQKYPPTVPWSVAGVEYVVEASGMFTNLDKASGHLASDTVKRVIITAPSVDAPMVIIGVNDNKIKTDLKVISCGSSTLYCLAPIIKILEEQYGVEDGFITSIHAMTPSLKPLDGLCLRGKHWRDHRSIMQNIIPATTGACKALGKIIPQVKDKISGLAFRVPIINVSVLDLTIRLVKATSLPEILKTIEKASKTTMNKIISISNEETVSSDFMDDTHSCIVDAETSLQHKPDFYKLVCWYENEFSYACRVIDLILMSEKYFEELSNEMTVVSLMQSWTQDAVLQTENKLNIKTPLEISYLLSTVDKKQSTLQINPKNTKKISRFMKKPLHNNNAGTPTTTNDSSNKRIEIFKIWNDDIEVIKPTNMRQNRSSFFQEYSKPLDRIVDSSDVVKTQATLEKVKLEFSKMAGITEQLLRKSYNSKFQLNSKSKEELTEPVEDSSNPTMKNTASRVSRSLEHYKTCENKPVKLDVCGDIEVSKCTIRTINSSANDCSKEHVDNNFEKDKSNYSLVETINSTEQSIQILEVAPAFKSMFHVQNKPTQSDGTIKCKTNRVHDSKLLLQPNSGFKSHMSKTFSNIINLTKNFQFQSHSSKQDGPDLTQCVNRVEHDGTKHKQDINQMLCENGKIIEINVQKNTPSNVTVSVRNIAKEHKCLSNDLIDNIPTQDVDKRNENIPSNNKLSAAEIISIELLDEELKRNIVLVDQPSLSAVSCDQVSALKGMDDDFTIEIKRSKGSIPAIPAAVVVVNGNATNPSRIKTVDIYDKLDSASSSASENSLKDKKSQVIHITDLTNSLDDLERLDKICKIIEISDELSDKLFSPLDDGNENTNTTKRWSFKDLCEKIKLDDFCNKVFGK